jgi:hypothetical protein
MFDADPAKRPTFRTVVASMAKLLGEQGGIDQCRDIGSVLIGGEEVKPSVVATPSALAMVKAAAASAPASVVDARTVAPVPPPLTAAASVVAATPVAVPGVGVGAGGDAAAAIAVATVAAGVAAAAAVAPIRQADDTDGIQWSEWWSISSSRYFYSRSKGSIAQFKLPEGWTKPTKTKHKPPAPPQAGLMDARIVTLKCTKWDECGITFNDAVDEDTPVTVAALDPTKLGHAALKIGQFVLAIGGEPTYGMNAMRANAKGAMGAAMGGGKFGMSVAEYIYATVPKEPMSDETMAMQAFTLAKMATDADATAAAENAKADAKGAESLQRVKAEMARVNAAKAMRDMDSMTNAANGGGDDDEATSAAAGGEVERNPIKRAAAWASNVADAEFEDAVYDNADAAAGQTCIECGVDEMLQTLHLDPIDGNNYCDSCWEELQLLNEEESSGTPAAKQDGDDDGVTAAAAAYVSGESGGEQEDDGVCGNCGDANAKLHNDEVDGQRYCAPCWTEFYGEAPGGAKKVKKKGSKKKGGKIAKLTAADVGKRCTVEGYECGGTVRFVGPSAEDGKAKVGIELDEALGKHGGTSKGHVYFKCPKKCGVLVGPTKVVIVGGRRTDGKCSYTSANGNCRAMAQINMVYCTQHTCSSKGCEGMKGSRETMCKTHGGK